MEVGGECKGGNTNQLLNNFHFARNQTIHVETWLNNTNILIEYMHE